MTLDRKAISARVDRVLRPLGFVRGGLTWNRRADPVVDVVTLQLSKAGDSFTLNLGILDPEAYALCWGEPPGERPDEAQCTIRTRLGELAAGRDVWWEGSDDVTLGSVGSALVVHGIPFLDANRSTTAMEQYLAASRQTGQSFPPPFVYWAALKARNGDREGACALLRDLQRRTNDAWRPKIQAALGRLGCT